MSNSNGAKSEPPPQPEANGALVPVKPVAKDLVAKGPVVQAFDQPVVLRQSPTWSRAIAWGIMGVTTSAIVWACLAKLDSAIPASGKLEPQGRVQAVKVPVGGVVKALYVQEGKRVNQGDLLLTLDPTAAQAQLTSAETVRTALLQENQFYRAQLSGAASSDSVARQAVRLTLPSSITSLTKSRAALLSETQLYRAQLRGSMQGMTITADQQALFQSSQSELSSRLSAAQLAVGQLERQLQENYSQLASAQDILAVNRTILNDITPLSSEGGISRVQFLKQRQEVRSRQAEVERLSQEQERLKLAIAQAKAQRQNTVSLSQKELLTQIADNQKRIAEIDDQLTRSIVENEKRLAEIDNQLSQAKLTLQYQELRAPVAGTVFELKPSGSGFVANSTEPILSIVPGDALVAKVYITNQDIGFVRENMTVDVRVDSFPFSEFGDIKGKVSWIGSDALPPDQIRQYYSFPATIRLDRQSIAVNGRPVSLQSGMSVSANIKLRQRTVISIFTDLFVRNTESLRFVR